MSASGCTCCLGCSLALSLPVYAAPVVCAQLSRDTAEPWASSAFFLTTHSQVWEIRGFRETSTPPKWETLLASHCTLSLCQFLMQLLKYFLVFFPPSSHLLLSYPHFLQTIISFNPSSNFSPQTHRACWAGRGTEALPNWSGHGDASSCKNSTRRDFPVPCAACRHTPVLCHSWAVQIWNLIPEGLGGRLFYLFSLQRKANRMGIHRSWERNISQGKHTVGSEETGCPGCYAWIHLGTSSYNKDRLGEEMKRCKHRMKKIFKQRWPRLF